MNNALFGHRLRTYRKEKGLTIEKLAEQVGLSPNYLGDVERGKKLPSMATFIRLVNVLDVSADELLKDEVNRTHPCMDPFTCKVCGWPVVPAGAGSSHRNHCPNCLYSLHLDREPGDRASDCHGRMEPIGVWVRKNGEWAIIHRCLRCGKIGSNRIAADDNPMKLMALAMRPFGSSAVSREEIRDMTVSMES